MRNRGTGFSSTANTPPWEQLATHASPAKMALVTVLATLFALLPGLAQILGRVLRSCWRGFGEA
jgi:hypothetical protein